jgi:peptidoglycan-N-acetylglucosamine deacetylase
MSQFNFKKISIQLVLLVDLLLIILILLSLSINYKNNIDQNKKFSNLSYKSRLESQNEVGVRETFARFSLNENDYASIRQNSTKLDRIIIRGSYFDSIENKPTITVINNYYSKEIQNFISENNRSIDYWVELGVENIYTDDSIDFDKSSSLNKLIESPELHDQTIKKFVDLLNNNEVKGVVLNTQNNDKIYTGGFLNKLITKLSKSDINIDLLIDNSTIINKEQFDKFDNIIFSTAVFKQSDIFNKTWRPSGSLIISNEDILKKINNLLSTGDKYSILYDTNSYQETKDIDDIIWQSPYSYTRIISLIKSYNLPIVYSEKGFATVKYENNTYYINDATSLFNQLKFLEKSNIDKSHSIGINNLNDNEPLQYSVLKDNKNIQIQEDLEKKYLVSNQVNVEGSGTITSLKQKQKYGDRKIGINSDGYIISQEIVTSSQPAIIGKTGLKDKTVAITFDDGPDLETTPKILDILKFNEVKGTFYTLGVHVKSNPEIAKRIIKEGHEIGNHTYYHPSTNYLPFETYKEELNSTQQIILETTDQSSKLFRTPFNEGNSFETTSDTVNIEFLNSLGFVVSEFDIDSFDYFDNNSDTIVNKVVEQVEKNNGGQILFHDQNKISREQLLIALPKIIKNLKEKGYKFETSSQLIPDNYKTPNLDEKDNELKIKHTLDKKIVYKTSEIISKYPFLLIILIIIACASYFKSSK